MWYKRENDLPFVEGGRSFLGHHGPGAVDGTLVLTRRGVHVPGLHHVHRGRDHRGDEAGAKGRHKVARKVVCVGSQSVTLNY